MDISRNTVTGEIIKEKSLGNSFREGDWVDCIDRTTGNIKESEQPFIDAWDLQQAKTAKIAELKKNRDLKNISPIDTVQAYEMIDGNTTTNLVKFLFLTAPTGNTATEPNNLLFGVLLNSAVITGYRLPYSCQIIDSEVTLPDGTLQKTLRRGYVAIDGAVAGSLSNHFAGRATTNIQIINEKETLINNATTMEELEAIDLTLPTNENDTRYI